MSSHKISGIYTIRSEINNKQYVGSAVTVYSRWRTHRSDLRKNRHTNHHLQNAWNKYGEDAFEFVLLEECTVDQLIEREQYYLDTTPNLYNINKIAGSWLGMKHTDETKAKISASGKGREVSQETRSKISAGNKGNSNWLGRKHTPETREKISAAAKAHASTDEGRATLDRARDMSTRFAGRNHTPETRAKMSLSAIGRKASPETRAKISAAAKEREARKRETAQSHARS